MHEAMARYQTLYGLKPIGAHRQMADELFNDVTILCKACGGQSLRDVNSGASWERCISCRGLGILFTKPAAEIAGIRRRVLDAFSGAAADPIPRFVTAPLAYDLSQARIVDLSTQASQRNDPAVQAAAAHLAPHAEPGLARMAELAHEPLPGVAEV